MCFFLPTLTLYRGRITRTGDLHGSVYPCKLGHLHHRVRVRRWRPALHSARRWLTPRSAQTHSRNAIEGGSRVKSSLAAEWSSDLLVLPSSLSFLFYSVIPPCVFVCLCSMLLIVCFLGFLSWFFPLPLENILTSHTYTALLSVSRLPPIVPPQPCALLILFFVLCSFSSSQFYLV